MENFYALINLPSKPEEFSLPPHFYISDQGQSSSSSAPVPCLQGSPSTSRRDPKLESKCDHCGKGFKTDQAKFGHMRIHQDKSLKGTLKRPADHLLPYRWASTRKRVRKPVIDMNSLEDVVAVLTLMEMSRSKSNDSWRTMESDPLDEKKHASENCNRSFPSDQALVEHGSSHKKKRKNEAIQEPTEVLKNGEVQKSRKRKRKVKSESGSHVCEVCNESYATGQQLGGHKRAHYKKKLISTTSEVPNGQADMAQNAVNECL
ncbi:zinc finger protein ZAT3-like [Carex rostrata]